MLANIPILRGDYSVECAVIVLLLLVLSLLWEQRLAPWVSLLGVFLFFLPFVSIVYFPNLAEIFPYDLVWHLSLAIIVVGVPGLGVQILSRAAKL